MQLLGDFFLEIVILQVWGILGICHKEKERAGARRPEYRSRGGLDRGDQGCLSQTGRDVSWRQCQPNTLMVCMQGKRRSKDASQVFDLLICVQNGALHVAGRFQSYKIFGKIKSFVPTRAKLYLFLEKAPTQRLLDAYCSLSTSPFFKNKKLILFGVAKCPAKSQHFFSFFAVKDGQ